MKDQELQSLMQSKVRRVNAQMEISESLYHRNERIPMDLLEHVAKCVRRDLGDIASKEAELTFYPFNVRGELYVVNPGQIVKLLREVYERGVKDAKKEPMGCWEIGFVPKGWRRGERLTFHATRNKPVVATLTLTPSMNYDPSIHIKSDDIAALLVRDDADLTRVNDWLAWWYHGELDRLVIFKTPQGHYGAKLAR